MNPILVLAIVGGLYYLLQRQQQDFSLALRGLSQSQQQAIASNKIGATSGANFTQPNMMGSQMLDMGVNAGISVGTQTAASIATNLGSSLGKAIPIIGAAVGAIADVLLAQHAARIKGATNENMAADQVVPSYDVALVGIANAYNARQIDQNKAVASLKQLDSITFDKLRSLVGPPGTAWKLKNGQSGPATAWENIDTHTNTTCDRGCTVGCCIYYTALSFGVETVIAAILGNYKRWDSGDLAAPTRRDLGAYIPQVGGYSAGSQYSHYKRDAYWIKVVN